MKKKEIVILDCGIEVRQEEQGVLFNCIDPGREFAFGLKQDEIPDMIIYLNSYLALREPKQYLAATKLSEDRPKREMTVQEKINSIGGVTGVSLAGSASASGRVVPASAVSVHKG